MSPWACCCALLEQAVCCSSIRGLNPQARSLHVRVGGSSSRCCSGLLVSFFGAQTAMNLYMKQEGRQEICCTAKQLTQHRSISQLPLKDLMSQQLRAKDVKVFSNLRMPGGFKGEVQGFLPAQAGLIPKSPIFFPSKTIEVTAGVPAPFAITAIQQLVSFIAPDLRPDICVCRSRSSLHFVSPEVLAVGILVEDETCC